MFENKIRIVFSTLAENNEEAFASFRIFWNVWMETKSTPYLKINKSNRKSAVFNEFKALE